MRKRTNSDYAGRRSIRILSLAVLLTLLVPVAMLASVAQATPQKTFRSPAQAVEALYTAAKMNNSAELTQIFGPQAKDLLSSGDPVSDKADRERVVKKYDEMHRLVTEPDKSVRLYLGAENWPLSNTRRSRERCARRCDELHVQRNDDSWIRHRGISSDASKFWSHDVHRQSGRQHLPKGFGNTNGSNRSGDEGIQPG